jgi:hypothetical protein
VSDIDKARENEAYEALEEVERLRTELAEARRFIESIKQSARNARKLATIRIALHRQDVRAIQLEEQAATIESALAAAEAAALLQHQPDPETVRCAREDATAGRVSTIDEIIENLPLSQVDEMLRKLGMTATSIKTGTESFEEWWMCDLLRDARNMIEKLRDATLGRPASEPATFGMGIEAGSVSPATAEAEPEAITRLRETRQGGGHYYGMMRDAIIALADAVRNQNQKGNQS